MTTPPTREPSNAELQADYDAYRLRLLQEQVARLAAEAKALGLDADPAPPPPAPRARRGA